MTSSTDPQTGRFEKLNEAFRRGAALGARLCSKSVSRKKLAAMLAEMRQIRESIDAVLHEDAKL